MLEFAALIALRVKEPELERPFRVPGGIPTALLVGVVPALLLALALVHGEPERILGLSSVAFGLILIALGVVAYGVNIWLRPRGWSAPAAPSPEAAG